MRVDVVIPTIGRPELTELVLAVLAVSPRETRVILVDDRSDPDSGRLTNLVSWAHVAQWGDRRVSHLRSLGRGPAAARNVGWRDSDAEWVAFLDDDVMIHKSWWRELDRDLWTYGDEESVAAIQGRIHVPRPVGRPTDWQRSVINLEGSFGITADMVIRRAALEKVEGFDENFPRAYREDTDLVIRLRAAGYRLELGDRNTTHRLLPGRRYVSLRKQLGNVDDAYMNRKHGRGWRGEPGRLPLHAVTTLLLVGGVAAPRMCRLGFRVAWLGVTAEFAYRRIAPGPRTGEEIWDMIVTSAAIPPLAVYRYARGWHRARRLLPSRAG